MAIKTIDEQMERRATIEDILRMARANHCNGEQAIHDLLQALILCGLTPAACGKLDLSNITKAKLLLEDREIREEICWRFHWGDQRAMPEEYKQ